MVARFTGASLGLLAFTISITAGLCVHNPVEVTLARSILALFVFCTIGLLLGAAAQAVIAEHAKKRESEIRNRYHEDSAGMDVGSPESGSRGGEAGPVGT